MMFMKGFLQILQDTKSKSLKNILMAHLQTICSDADDWPWEWVRDYHATILTRMEKGWITWESTEAIKEIRNQGLLNRNSHKSAPAATSKKPTSGKQGSAGNPPCPDFQIGQCQQTGHHDQVRHICNWCWTNHRNPFRQAESACLKKQSRQFNKQANANKSKN